jgi:hypothetical protein
MKLLGAILLAAILVSAAPQPAAASGLPKLDSAARKRHKTPKVKRHKAPKVKKHRRPRH